ncbi:uncharacterized protein [Hyperolius riggenbachi]|uniref:uncharacterized protein isoform X3 n=1 Tax=Hyperolius riggenbachi TaxID=752182 RepID=UPI0035A3C4E7
MIAVQSALVFLLCGIAQCWERVYHVRGPRSWTVGVPEAVTVEAVGYEESFPVQLSLLSYPDKKMTYDSQQLQLSPSNRHWGSTSLLINPEDFPSRDEDEQFVYLVVESDGLIKEEKLPVTDQRRSLLTPKTKQDLRERARSKRSTLLEEMLSKIIYERMKRCCSKGFAHYKKEWKCIQGMKKKKNEETERCSEMFRNCCLKAKTFSERPLQVALGDVPSSCMTGPRSWTVGVPQVISVYWFPYEECDVNNFTISLLSYPDKNITYVSKQFLAIKAGLYEEKFTLMLKHEDMPRGEMKEIAYLVAQRGTDNVEAEVLLVDRPVSSQERDPAGKYNETEEEKCWEGYRHYVRYWQCSRHMIEYLLEDTDSKAYWECCSHTRGHFWKLVAAGHVTLTNQKRRRYPVPVHIFFLDY